MRTELLEETIACYKGIIRTSNDLITLEVHQESLYVLQNILEERNRVKRLIRWYFEEDINKKYLVDKLISIIDNL